MKFWFKTAALIGGVWILAAIVIHFASASQPTAASVARVRGQSVDLGTLQGDARARAIDRMEQMVNRLTFDERQQLDRKGVNHDFFHKLTPAEQGAYLDATLPTGFQQLMDVVQ